MIEDPTRPDVFIDDFGTVIGGVHDPADCAGRSCVMHNPSDHSMLSFPLKWRQADPLFDIKPSHFERICPHGIGHPDPDSTIWLMNACEIDVSVHGCDGCCLP